jgi:peptidoglycan/LPS O-acetylase OafA/YrhL
MKTLGDAFQSQSRDSQNNFLILRLLAASLVLYGHSFILGAPCPACSDWVSAYLHYRYSGDLGVHIFFLISGFLVFASFNRRHDLGQFIKARALRILPGLIVCVLIMALVLGPVMTTLPLADYFAAPHVREYIWGNGSLYRFIVDLPGVFATGPMPTVVNGSMWTLPAEVRLYLYVAVLGALGWTKGRWVANATIAALVILSFVKPDFVPLIASDPSFRRLGAFFGSGALLYINRESVPLDGKILALLVLTAFLNLSAPSFDFAASLVICYGVFWVAFARKVKLPRFIQDYSYGIYLYAWPIQQLTVRALPHAGPYRVFAISLLLAWAAGAASWFLVEKPCLRLKTRESLIQNAEHLTAT